MCDFGWMWGLAIYCDDATTAIDLFPGITIQSARQEFLGCVFDLKRRAAATMENSEQVFKRIVSQISEEYQVTKKSENGIEFCFL